MLSCNSPNYTSARLLALGISLYSVSKSFISLRILFVSGYHYIQLIPVRNKKLCKEEMPLLVKDKKYLIIDEIYDTGDIFSKVYDAIRIFDCDFAFLMSRYEHNSGETFVGKVLNHNKWIVFPWE